VTSSTTATLGAGGWLGLTRQGLPPCKKRQVSWRTTASSYAARRKQAAHQYSTAHRRARQAAPEPQPAGSASANCYATPTSAGATTSGTSPPQARDHSAAGRRVRPFPAGNLHLIPASRRARPATPSAPARELRPGSPGTSLRHGLSGEFRVNQRDCGRSDRAGLVRLNGLISAGRTGNPGQGSPSGNARLSADRVEGSRTPTLGIQALPDTPSQAMRASAGHRG